jgi:four helix bundle protein
MQDIFDVPGSTAPDATAPRLDFEKLDVYRVAVEFHALAASIRLPAGRLVLNTAEGGGRTGAADKARFYAMARGSAMECAALFDVLANLGITPRPTCARARALLVRIV